MAELNYFETLIAVADDYPVRTSGRAAGDVVWLVSRRWRTAPGDGLDPAREILAERFARGELSADEYRERLEQLR